jgi:hypothetical protein
MGILLHVYRGGRGGCKGGGALPGFLHPLLSDYPAVGERGEGLVFTILRGVHLWLVNKGRCQQKLWRTDFFCCNRKKDQTVFCLGNKCKECELFSWSLSRENYLTRWSFTLEE